MSLSDRINDDIKAAMLARESARLEALRAVKSALLLLRTQEGSDGTITPDDEIRLLQRLVKQRRESAALYQSQNRPDLAETEINQAAFIEAYLPQQLSEEEMESLVKQAIESSGASSVRDMGKVMGLASQLAAGRADNKALSGIVKRLLGA